MSPSVFQGITTGIQGALPPHVRPRVSEDEHIDEGSGEDAEGDEGVGPHEVNSHTGKVVW